MEPTLLTIAEAAARTGLAATTLRYYERAGLLLAPVGRAPSRHRRYSADDLRWVEMLTCLRATGMPIRTLRAYAALVRAGAGSEAQRMALLEAHRAEVRAAMAETRRHLEAIERKIDLYRSHLAAEAAAPAPARAPRPRTRAGVAAAR